MVGRVGALAVALGVGAMWFSGGVASADSSSDSGTSGRTSHARGADDSASRATATQRSARTNRTAPAAAADTNDAGAQNDSRPSAAASARAADLPATPKASAAEAVDATPSADEAPVVQVSAPADWANESAAPAGEAAAPQSATPVVAAVAPEEAPATAEVSALAAGTDIVDPTADGNPALPVDSPLEWAMAAFARRNALLSSAVSPTYTQGQCTQQSTSCTYIMGPSGVPIPSQAYADTVMKFYVLPNSIQPDTTAQIVFTPEGAYPVTGIKALPLTISAEQGQTILENTINYLQPGPEAGTMPITIFGYSQSAVISSLLQRSLDDAPPGYLPGLDRQGLRFVTVGQEMAPDGGWFARYPGLDIPSMGEFFFGSTPRDSFPTTNYTLMYDGFGDSPRYPGNFLSSLNAAMGILLVHINYASESYFQKTYGVGFGAYDAVMGTEGPGVACNQGSPSCIKLPTSDDATQKYYLIKTPQLPLLAPVRAIPFIGKPLAALVEPVLKVIVDLGYGDRAHGFNSAPPQPNANEPTPFGLFPQVSPIEVVQKLAAGVGQGLRDFVRELGAGGGGGGNMNLPTLKDLLGIATTIIKELPARVNAGLSALYGTVLATADFLNAAVFTLPAYNLQLAVDSIKKVFKGELSVVEGLISAVGLPWAADVGLAAVIGVVQVTVWLEGILAALTGCGPAAPQAGMCLIPSLA